MSCPSVTTIQKTECIGNSLATINANYDSLATAACDNQAQIDELRSLINGLSSNMNKNVIYPYAEFRTAIVVGTSNGYYYSSTMGSSLIYKDSDFSVTGYPGNYSVGVQPGTYNIEIDCSNLFSVNDPYNATSASILYPGVFSYKASSPSNSATLGVPTYLPGAAGVGGSGYDSKAYTAGGVATYSTKRVFASTDTDCRLGPTIYGALGYRSYYGGQVVLRIWKLA